MLQLMLLMILLVRMWSLFLLFADASYFLNILLWIFIYVLLLYVFYLQL